MADQSESALSVISSNSENKENEDASYEPEQKKQKLETSKVQPDYKLQERLSGILCCTVCLDLPRTCFQVSFLNMTEGD